MSIIIMDFRLGQQVGRASPSALDQVHVSLNGRHVPLVQLATTSSRSARSLAVSVHDPANVEAIEAAIKAAKMDLVTSAQSTTIVVTFPKLTREVRDELLKEVKVKEEDTKERLRKVRQEAITRLKFASLTVDELHEAKEAVQALLDGHIEGIEVVAAEKNKEINAP